MIRRLDFDMFRSVRHIVKRSPRKFAIGGSLTMLALYNLPSSACAADNKGSMSSFVDSIAQFVGGSFPFKTVHF